MEKIKGKGRTEKGTQRNIQQAEFTGQETEKKSEFWSALTMLMQKSGASYEIINI